MVQKGKRKQKKPSKKPQKKILLHCGNTIYKLPLKGSDTKLQESLLLDLKQELDHIYTLYLYDLINRFNSIPFILASYKLQEFSYRLEQTQISILRSKVKKLMKNDHLAVIYNIFYVTIHKFLEDIQKELNKFHTCPNEIIVMCLAEALNALECSAKELGKITENMPEHSEIEENCENITKIAFFDKILRKYEEILIKHSHFSDSVILHNMITLLEELKKTKLLKNFINEEISKDFSDNSIEEIMNFINGDTLQKTQKKDVQQMKFLDEEIENFKQALEKSQLYTCKPKPNLTTEWIRGLKSQIEQNKLITKQ